ncbi:colicin E3/pyocin S6 family cytotoxin [Pseudomonas corrugata]
MAPSKTFVRGGGVKRRRWKDRAGRIYEWDSQHAAVELYTKQGKHLGEFNPVTGEQTKPADPTRKVEK